jgi:hypothetical protein
MLYGKATEVALTDVDTASSLTLMSADIERIVTGMETGHEVRLTPPLSASKVKVCWFPTSPGGIVEEPHLYLLIISVRPTRCSSRR